MTLQNKGTYHDKITLYIDPEKKELIKKAKLLFARENSSLSKWFVEELERYVNVHSPGNPQQNILRLLQGDLPYKAPKLCACGRKATRKNMLNNGQIVWSCSLHAPAKERVKMWKPIK